MGDGGCAMVLEGAVMRYEKDNAMMRCGER